MKAETNKVFSYVESLQKATNNGSMVKQDFLREIA